MKTIPHVSGIRNTSEVGSRRRKEADFRSGANSEARLLTSAATRARERGSAVAVLLVMLAIMMILVAANGKTLLHLQRELRLIERQQAHRLNAAQTNAVIVVPSSTAAVPPGP